MVIAAIIRVVRLAAVFSDARGDSTWTFYDVSIWTSIEVSVGIFCVSAPAMKPIIRRYTPGLLSSSMGPSSNAHSRTQDTYGSKQQFSNRASKRRWTLRQNGIIELADQDPEWSGAAKSTSGSTWGVNESSQERGMGSMGKGGIVKSMSVSVDVAQRGVSEDTQGKSSLRSQEDLNGRSFVRMNGT